MIINKYVLVRVRHMVSLVGTTKILRKKHKKKTQVNQETKPNHTERVSFPFPEHMRLKKTCMPLKYQADWYHID